MAKKKKARAAAKTAIQRLQGRSFLLGGNGKDPGKPFDCFGMLVEYCYIRYGIDLYAKFSDKYPFDDYAEDYKKDTGLTLCQLSLFLDRVFVKVGLGYIVPGDILFLSYEDKRFIGINVGLQRVLITSPETGCIILGSEYYNIEEAYRCLQQSHQFFN
jgi:hypothetical protein